ncbi:MAG: peroxide stress protein YaaA [Pseudomonadota bacterium]|jgi:cytoplasmic iron level regulating protein YaaA (DUF328/UPF0246 family)
MLLLLSPAKSLNIERKLPQNIQTSLPRDQSKALILINQLRQLHSSEIARLMDLSDTLTTLNVHRYQKFQNEANALNAYCALLMFDGDVYDGLDANTLSIHQWTESQNKVRILSGLYGVLRPLDLIQPYRLEMGTRLTTPNNKNLYQYWGLDITNRLNQDLERYQHSVVLNLASEEYFKAIQPKKLKASIVNCIFLDEKNGTYKIISFFAKRARGMMARFILDQAINDFDSLKSFNSEGYQWSKADSSDTVLIFKRPKQIRLIRY